MRLLLLLTAIFLMFARTVPAVPSVTAQETAQALYEEGTRLEAQEDEEAVAAYREAAAQGNLYAQAAIVARDDLTLFSLKSAALLAKLKALDDPEAAYLAGKLLLSKDKADEAVLLLEKAAKAGHAPAQYELGRCAMEGKGMPENKDLAVQYFRSAGSYAPAEYAMALCYDNGTGVRQDDAEAAQWYRRAAEHGHISAAADLGWCYEHGTGVPEDAKEAVSWYQKAARRGSATAQCNLANCYYYGIGTPQDIDQAVQWYRKAAEQNDPRGMNDYGMLFKNGAGVPQDTDQARAWLTKSAEADYALAQANLGNLLHELSGGTGSEEAAKWFALAAAQGHAQAENNLAAYYENGWGGMPQDHDMAMFWLKEAADGGYALAQYTLAVFKLDGDAEDQAQAVSLLISSAEQNFAKAQIRLALCYRHGTGVEKNQEMAISWLAMAASLGDATAQTMLGWEFLTGKNVRQDETKAFELFCKAAEQGDAEAEYCVAECYEFGDGVEKDKSEAVRWYRKAARHGHKDAVKRLEELGD